MGNPLYRLILITSLSLAYAWGCSDAGFTSHSGKSAADRSAPAPAGNPTPNTIYVPVGGSRTIGPGTPCQSSDASIATCQNGVVIGNKVGETDVSSAPLPGTSTDAANAPTHVVVYDPSNPPPGVDNAGNGAPAILGVDGQLVACPKTPQTILILDFKSGWWAGDGGDFFEKILSSLQGACGANVSIEYHHIVFSDHGYTPNVLINTMQIVPGGAPTDGSTNFQSAFSDPSFASYTQIWLLSGSEADPLDLPVAHPFFQSVLQAATSSNAAFLIGCGYGSISHANAMAQALGLGASLSTLQPEGRILDPIDGVQIASTIGAGKLQNHVLFSNGVTNLPDDMIVGGDPANGDAINPSGGVTVIASDNHGQATIAVSTTGRRAVFDANLARYYSIWQDESPSALQLIRNIAVYLSAGKLSSP